MSHHTSRYGEIAGDGAPAFRCDVRASGRAAAWIRVYGDLDMATVPQFEAILSRAFRTARLLVIDLRELAFIDSSGGHAIDRAAVQTRRSDRRLVLVRGPAQIDRLLTLVGLDRRLEIVDLKPVLLSAPPAAPALVNSA